MLTCIKTLQLDIVLLPGFAIMHSVLVTKAPNMINRHLWCVSWLGRPSC